METPYFCIYYACTLSASGMHVDPWDNLDISMASIWKTLVKRIMDFSPFCLYHRWTVILLMHFNFKHELKFPQCFLFYERVCKWHAVSVCNKTAFHGALQINVVWLIGYFLNAFTVLIGRQSQLSWSKSVQQRPSRRCLSCLTGRIKDGIKQ